MLGRVLQLDGDYLIQVPANIFEHGLVLPNFPELFSNPKLWSIMVATIVTLTLIDGVESLATVAAIDKIDPFHRKSNPNRTLLAMGISNICSSLAGGLTIIPGGVKSTTCIVSGGRTLWANFYNALFLVVFLFFARAHQPDPVQHHRGGRDVHRLQALARPKVWRHVAHIGREQIFVFSATVAMHAWTDLLWGIVFGMVVKLLVNVVLASRVTEPGARRSPAQVAAEACRQCVEMFRNPVATRQQEGGAYRVYFNRSVVCFNSLYVVRELAAVPADAELVHTAPGRRRPRPRPPGSNLSHFMEEFEQEGQRRRSWSAWKNCTRSHHELAMRVRIRMAAASPGHAWFLPSPPAAASSARACSSMGRSRRGDRYEWTHAVGAANSQRPWLFACPAPADRQRRVGPPEHDAPQRRTACRGRRSGRSA